MTDTGEICDNVRIGIEVQYHLVRLESLQNFHLSLSMTFSPRLPQDKASTVDALSLSLSLSASFLKTTRFDLGCSLGKFATLSVLPPLHHIQTLRVVYRPTGSALHLLCKVCIPYTRHRSVVSLTAQQPPPLSGLSRARFTSAWVSP